MVGLVALTPVVGRASSLPAVRETVRGSAQPDAIPAIAFGLGRYKEAAIETTMGDVLLHWAITAHRPTGHRTVYEIPESTRDELAARLRDTVAEQRTTFERVSPVDVDALLQRMNDDNMPATLRKLKQEQLITMTDRYESSHGGADHQWYVSVALTPKGVARAQQHGLEQVVLNNLGYADRLATNLRYRIGQGQLKPGEVIPMALTIKGVCPGPSALANGNEEDSGEAVPRNVRYNALCRLRDEGLLTVETLPVGAPALGNGHGKGNGTANGSAHDSSSGVVPVWRVAVPGTVVPQPQVTWMGYATPTLLFDMMNRPNGLQVGAAVPSGDDLNQHYGQTAGAFLAAKHELADTRPDGF
ncbi:MAG: hypothetical protein KC476_11810, partial [Cyanobacteria bacterium HKST-UBA06]|nr:hypothetical protein [Cyanobacteria bacterium HKST-UBA06]